MFTKEEEKEITEPVLKLSEEEKQEIAKLASKLSQENFKGGGIGVEPISFFIGKKMVDFYVNEDGKRILAIVRDGYKKSLYSFPLEGDFR